MTEEMKTDMNKALIEQAFIFSFPLVLMDITKEVSTNTVEPGRSKAPVNRFLHAKSLATSEFRQVVTPNVDTLYSQVFFDLKDDALVIKKPYADRYLTFQIMDAWSNTVAILGTGGDTEEEKTYVLTGPSFRGDIPQGMSRIKVPTAIGWLIGRTICYLKMYPTYTNCKVRWMQKLCRFICLMVKCRKALTTRAKTVFRLRLQ